MEPDPQAMLRNLAFCLGQMTASTQEEADAAAAAMNPVWKLHHEKLKANPLSAEQARIYGGIGIKKLSAAELRNMLQQAAAQGRPIDINFLGNAGESPLHDACIRNDKERAKVLLQFGRFNIISQQCCFSKSPFPSQKVHRFRCIQAQQEGPLHSCMCIPSAEYGEFG